MEDLTKKRKTALDLELEQYQSKIKLLDQAKLQKELEKLEKKCSGNFVNANTGKVVTLDILNNAEQKNRLYVRKNIMSTTKWIGYLVKHIGEDYAVTWQHINATFVSKNILPDWINTRLENSADTSFLDTLSLKGLKLYNKYLICIANMVIFEKYDLSDATQQAKYHQFAIMDELQDQSLFDVYILPKTWKTLYKTIMKQKFCKDQLELINNKTI